VFLRQHPIKNVIFIWRPIVWSTIKDATLIFNAISDKISTIIP
jgi:hypothetical protein